ncbi:efflux RND transporter periplasmic adaptor subunit [Prochlorococcus marinus]|uniref:efflux RND transporter periplasmic adaptor subunit n=1 Tax=Prochlorococcus marinus TaxID=1219 RepID=UPI0022B5BDC8|nr:efflux RND transporter periplasmic adaptor subunit [Prochlorococcus marinus]
MKGLSKKKVINLFSFLIVIILANVIFKAGPGQKQKKDLSSFTVIAEEGKLPSVINSSGELQAQKSLNVNPSRQGIIEDIYVKEGDEVNKGQLIAKIEDRDFKFRFDEMEADFQNKEASFERRKELFLQGGISKETYDGFMKDFLISKAKLNQIKIEGEELFIKAPLKGIITSRYAEPGTFVSPNSRNSNNESSVQSAVVEISQGIEVISKVPESDIGRIQIGQKGSVRVEAFPDERFSAFVSDIAPRAIRNNNVTSFEVALSIINPPKKLRIGMTVDIEFKVSQSALSTIVPTVSIVTKDGEPGLLIVGENKEPVFQKVDLGSSSGNKTAIIKGINPGDKIFIDIPPWSKKKRN